MAAGVRSRSRSSSTTSVANKMARDTPPTGWSSWSRGGVLVCHVDHPEASLRLDSLRSLGSTAAGTAPTSQPGERRPLPPSPSRERAHTGASVHLPRTTCSCSKQDARSVSTKLHESQKSREQAKMRDDRRKRSRPPAKRAAERSSRTGQRASLARQLGSLGHKLGSPTSERASLSRPLSKMTHPRGNKSRAPAKMTDDRRKRSGPRA